jgi:hypothetical protein
MNTSAPRPTIEIVPLPIGGGWRVRIDDGRHLQFVSGFAARSDAEEWISSAAQAWLATLSQINGRL